MFRLQTVNDDLLFLYIREIDSVELQKNSLNYPLQRQQNT